MMSRGEIRRLNTYLKRYDRYLKAMQNGNCIAVYRKENSGVYSLVFALTDNWSLSGNSRRWGVEVILQRLRAIEVWNNPQWYAELEKKNEESKESHFKDFGNNVESFLYDFRSQFAKATNDINIGTLDKKKDNRRKKDGYCK